MKRKQEEERGNERMKRKREEARGNERKREEDERRTRGGREETRG